MTHTVWVFAIAFTAVLVSGAIIIALVVRKRSAEKDTQEQKRLQIVESLLHKFNNSSELIEFLKSEQGMNLLEGKSAATSTSHWRTILLVCLSILCFWFGLGSLFAAFAGFSFNSSLPQNLDQARIPQFIFIAQGLVGAVLAGAGIYFFVLSQVWKKPSSK